MKKGFAEGLCREVNEMASEFRKEAGVIKLSEEVERLLKLQAYSQIREPDDTDELDDFDKMDELEINCEAECKATPSDMFFRLKGCPLDRLSDFKFRVGLEEMAKFMNLSSVQIALLIVIRKMEYWSSENASVAQIAKYTNSTQEAVLKLQDDFQILEAQNLIQSSDSRQPFDQQCFTKYSR